MPLRACARLSRGAAALVIIFGSAWFPPVGTQEPATPEISTQDTQPGFMIRSRRNEVLVRVVVRDAQGKAVSTLSKDDFRLYDNGKAQAIEQFSVERAGAAVTSRQPPGRQPAVEKPPEQAKPAAAPPSRFVAFYFDDTFMSFEDIVHTRDAAVRYLKTSLTPEDRVALYTSSGRGGVDFTGDRDKLEEALSKLAPHPLGSNSADQCPYISEYEAYMISEREDAQAIEVAVANVINCVCGGSVAPAGTPGNVQINPCQFNPQTYAKTTARSIWVAARFGHERSLRGLEELVRRLSVMPGQRSIVWVSPGFLAMDQTAEITSLVEDALRARVVINGLDSRGLWTEIPGGDASRPGSSLSGRLASAETSYALAAQETNQAVMLDASSGTGGVFVHDSNDYDGGFRAAGALAEVAYLLSFSPQNLKYNGKYHALRVELLNARGLAVQARKGYYAPAEAPDSEHEVKQDVVEAVFSREDRNDLPLSLRTQFFMTSPTEGQLSVIARVDLRGVRLRKEQGANVDELRFVAALFDGNGNLLEGWSRIMNLRLKDDTLKRMSTAGLETGWRFKVTPGTYVVREVLLDGGSGGIASVSRTVEIPYP